MLVISPVLFKIIKKISSYKQAGFGYFSSKKHDLIIKNPIRFSLAKKVVPLTQGSAKKDAILNLFVIPLSTF
jgi:hypothetical protein